MPQSFPTFGILRLLFNLGHGRQFYPGQSCSQPPEKAARCFAHNAEEHSSALVSEVRIDRDGTAAVVVRVKNGITYATADIRRSGQASTSAMVRPRTRLSPKRRAGPRTLSSA